MSDEVMLKDLSALLRALGLFDGARSESPHQVMQEAIAKAEALRKNAMLAPNAILEEAAKVCDRQAEMYTAERNKHEGDGPAWVRWNSKAYVCESNAQAIRALKT